MDPQQWTYDAYGQPVYVDPSLAFQHPDAQAYIQAAVAYQASADPDFQGLLLQQAALAEDQLDEEGQAGMTQAEKDAGLGSVFKRNDEDLKARRETDVRERETSFVSETYSECYPGYQEYVPEVVSDDEEDLTHMDVGRARGKGPNRSDFHNEEEWESYNYKREAAPRAAFQFGIKMADGRKNRKQKDQKLSSQLQKINTLIKEKQSENASAGVAGGVRLFDGGDGANKRRKV